MEYLHKNREQFMEAVARTAADTVFVAEAVEKDYYVSMILREMSETLPFAVFKGGTSLSKCYRVIKRFSEDIDLTADIPLSQGQKKKMKYCLKNLERPKILQKPYIFWQLIIITIMLLSK